MLLSHLKLLSMFSVHNSTCRMRCAISMSFLFLVFLSCNFHFNRLFVFMKSNIHNLEVILVLSFNTILYYCSQQLHTSIYCPFYILFIVVLIVMIAVFCWINKIFISILTLSVKNIFGQKFSQGKSFHSTLHDLFIYLIENNNNN